MNKYLIDNSLSNIETVQDMMTVEVCLEAVNAYSKYYQLLENDDFDDYYHIFQEADDPNTIDPQETKLAKKKNIFDKIIEFFKSIIEKIFGKKNNAKNANTSNSVKQSAIETEKEHADIVKECSNTPSVKNEKEKEQQIKKYAGILGLGAAAFGSIGAFIGKKFDKATDVLISDVIGIFINKFVSDPEGFESYFKSLMLEASKNMDEIYAEAGLESPNMIRQQCFLADAIKYEKAVYDLKDKYSNKRSIDIDYDADDFALLISINSHATNMVNGLGFEPGAMKKVDVSPEVTNRKYVENYVQQYVRFNHIPLLVELCNGIINFIDELNKVSNLTSDDLDRLKSLYQVSVNDPANNLFQFCNNDMGVHIVVRDGYATEAAALFNKREGKSGSLYDELYDKLKKFIDSNKNKEQSSQTENLSDIDSFMNSIIPELSKVFSLIGRLNKIILEELDLSRKYDAAHKQVMACIKTKNENKTAVKRLSELLHIKEENIGKDNDTYGT